MIYGIESRGETKKNQGDGMAQVDLPQPPIDTSSRVVSVLLPGQVVVNFPGVVKTVVSPLFPIFLAGRAGPIWDDN